MEQNHTPGRWKVENFKYKPPHWSDSLFEIVPTITNEDQVIAITSTPYRHGIDEGKHEQAANARLIAAAPDLLAACLMMMEENRRAGFEYAILTKSQLESANAAILKATGGEA